ncbi:MAG: hypothetical protein JSV80_15695 [Acidobacteriota bacterium]|nr:MAG: hypothetical protein JSV80_15695 [Acidobacteriota bacterium]
MEARPLAAVMIVGLLVLPSCSHQSGPSDQDRYRRYSRFTDPGNLSPMLTELPDDVGEIAEVASGLTVHHNLLPYHGVPRSTWPRMKRIWPPKMPDLLTALRDTGPGDLYADRPIEQRVVGGCMLESHLLTGMLRYRGIPVRARAGYFKNVQAHAEHVVDFWEKTLKERGINADLLKTDPQRWREEINAFTRNQVEIDKHIEHWVTEYWNEKTRSWSVLDANTTFLRASSALEVGIHLPREYFEYAFEAWQRMRGSENFNPDQYAEWPQDGRSHIRSQLLWDFYSLLNHDIAGFDQQAWPDDDTMSAEREAYVFIKERAFSELSAEELDELDRLALLLAREPTIDELVAFYGDSKTLRLVTAEKDPYSLVFDG